MSGWTWFWSVAWPRFWNSDVGKGLAIGIFIATTLFTMACCLIYPPAILTYTMAYVAGAAGFLVGAAICGFQSMSTGGDFWEGFADYVTNNWSQTLAITSLTCIVSVGFQTAAYLNVSRGINNIWPSNNGFEGKPEKIILEKGTLIDRYGEPSGRFAAPKGTPFELRSLPQEYLVTKKLHTYEVVKNVKVIQGTTAPWFNQPGGGIQYMFRVSIDKLIKQGVLIEIL